MGIEWWQMDADLCSTRVEMDTVLLGIIRSTHPEALKLSLTRLLVQRSAHVAVSEQMCQKILAAGVLMVRTAATRELAEAGAMVIKQWGRWNGSVLERCALQVVVEPLLSAAGPVDQEAGVALVGWLLDQLPEPAGRPLLPQLRSHLVTYASAAGHGPRSLAGLADLMTERPQCRPRYDEALQLARALIRALAGLRMPETSSDIAGFATHLHRLEPLFGELFSSTHTAISAMQTVYGVMSEPGGGACSALSVVLQAVPGKLVSPMCSQLVSVREDGDEATLRGIALLCDWLLLWPRCTQLATWLSCLLRQLASRRHTVGLDQLVICRVDKLFRALSLPAVRRSVFRVVTLMLLGFQSSPEVFHKVLPRLPALLDQLRQEVGPHGDDYVQLADVTHTLMRLHPTLTVHHPAVTRSLQHRPRPSAAAMDTLLRAAAWSHQSGLDLGCDVSHIAMSPPPRRGLNNLGNTCYINAVLQALFHSEQFRYEVMTSRPSLCQRHLAALQRVFAFLAFSERPTFSPSAFTRAALPPWFEAGRQQDCSELLRYLLDALHEEMSVAPSGDGRPQPQASSSSSQSPLSQLAQSPADGRQQTRPPPGLPVATQEDSALTLSSRPPADIKCRARWSSGGAAPCDVRLAGQCGTLQADLSSVSQEPPPSRRGSDVLSGDCRQPTVGGGHATDPAVPPAPTLVRRLLAGRAETTCTCCTCGSVSRHLDSITDLHLAVPDSLPAQPRADLQVSDLLEQYLAVERLSGENQYHCERCAELRDADRQLQLLQPPHYLVISLVRFLFERGTGARRKVLTRVALTERLWVPVRGGPAVQFRLYALVVHCGGSLDAGHYYCVARSSDDTGPEAAPSVWCRLDDNYVTPLSAGHLDAWGGGGGTGAPTDAPYMLFYRRCDGDAARPPLSRHEQLPVALWLEVQSDNGTYRLGGRPAAGAGWTVGGPRDGDDRPPPPTGCGGGQNASAPNFVC